MSTELADESAAPAAGPSDMDLIEAVRAGDAASFGQLYARHFDAARRLARTLVRDSSDADDLVAETFAKVLSKLKDGGGPDAAFRAYLLAGLRNTFYDRARRDRRLEVTDDLTRHDAGVPFVDTAVEGFERSVAARAFAKLPERWQVVLWHTEVEGDSPATVAPILGLTPNGVSALAYRARERLRQAYLQEHLTERSGNDCGWTIERLGAHVRGGLSNRDSARIDAHLSGCDRCKVLYVELGDVNAGMRGLLAPVVLGGAATAYLTAGAKAVASSAGLWGFTRHALTSWTGQVAVAGGGVAAAAIAAFTLAPHVTPAPPHEDLIANPRPGISVTVQPGVPGGSSSGTVPDDPSSAPNASTVPTNSAGRVIPGGSPRPGASGTPVTLASPSEAELQNEAGRANVTVGFDSFRPLVRGERNALVLAVTNNGGTEGTEGAGGAAVAGRLGPTVPDVASKPTGPATGRLTARISLPAGVTLRQDNAGDGWECSKASDGAVCHHPSLLAGKSTRARIQIAVAPDAATGVPRATVTSPNIGSHTVSASRGVVSAEPTKAPKNKAKSPTPRSAAATCPPAACHKRD